MEYGAPDEYRGAAGGIWLKQAEQQGEEKRMLTLGIRMNDPILEMNNGEFVWTIGETGSSLKARKPEPDTCGCTENVSIWLETKPEELVSWLFGCRKAEEIWGGQLENKGAGRDSGTGGYGERRVSG